ncbi:hypothetical protein [Rossellomorea marisflavi]|uniref:hypothetical protein n=1 Tax=Rossellomorea marisflavi TaxID=189381 RepID=UPI003458E75F
MKQRDEPVTCPYCGSILVVRERKYFCGFCDMILGEHQIQHNHERISVRIRDFVLDSYMEKSTPELMRLSTFELLSLLKTIRAERTDIYRYLNVFYRVRIKEDIEEFREKEEEAGQEYEGITRKMFVIENILRQRLGYVPHRISREYLEKYLEAMRRDKKSPMLIKQKRKNQ